MLSLLRIRPVPPPAARNADPPTAAVDRNLVAAIEGIISGHVATAAPLAGPAGASLGRLAAMLRAEREERLALVAGVAADTAATATHVGWITHDIREVANDSTKIAAAVDELARTITEISQSSAAVAGQVTALGRETSECVNKMRGAGEAMHLINESARGMSKRLAVLQAAVAQIADMAKIIQSISSQTNLLALNATIEAARAGEAGKGFAVVAGEVKSLSGQTAKATEQIRERIATLTAETEAIRQAIQQSIDTVASGDTAVQAAERQMGAVGSQMGDVSAHMSRLASTLGEHLPVTDQIAISTTRIADKGQKVRGEVDGVMDRLARAEARAWEVTQSFDTGTIADYELFRVKAELAIWMRKLAATLVGLMKPDPALAEQGTKRLLQWCEAGADEKMLGNHDVAAIGTAARKAHADAQRMIEAIVAQDWDVASDAYIAAEKAIAAVVEQAGTLTRAAR